MLTLSVLVALIVAIEVQGVEDLAGDVLVVLDAETADLVGPPSRLSPGGYRGGNCELGTGAARFAVGAFSV